MNYQKVNYEQGHRPDSYLASYLGQVQKLKRADRPDEAIAALLELVDATEEDNLFTGAGVMPAYYEQLAIIFRARKEYAKEVAILARYARQKHGIGDSRREVLKKRLEKAMKLLLKQQAYDVGSETARNQGGFLLRENFIPQGCPIPEA